MNAYLNKFPRFGFMVEDYRGTVRASRDSLPDAETAARRISYRENILCKVKRVEIVSTYTGGVDDTAKRVIDAS